MHVSKLKERDAEKIALARYGSTKFAESIKHWAFGKRTPLRSMSEWGSSICFVARENDELAGAIYGYTIPMHMMEITIEEGKKALEAFKPNKNYPMHPKFENQDVQKILLNTFINYAQRIGAQKITFTLKHEHKKLLRTLLKLGFRVKSTYHILEMEI